MDDVATLAQGCKVVGDRQIGAVVAASFARRGDQIEIGNVRQQFKSDQINIRRPIADRADHFGRRPAVDIERTEVRFDFAWNRDRLEIRDGHRQKRDVDRLIDQRFAERSRVSFDGSFGENDGMKAFAYVLIALSEMDQAIRLGSKIGRIEVESRLTIEREQGGRRRDVPDRGAARETSLADSRGERSRRNVRDLSNVVDRRDRSSAGDDDVHRFAALSLEGGRFSGLRAVVAAIALACVEGLAGLA